MRIATVHINHCHFDAGSAEQEITVTPIHAIVDFDLEIFGGVFNNLKVEAWHVIDAAHDSPVVTIGAPIGYRGSFNEVAFRKGIERFCRRFVRDIRRGSIAMDTRTGRRIVAREINPRSFFSFPVRSAVDGPAVSPATMSDAPAAI